MNCSIVYCFGPFLSFFRSGVCFVISALFDTSGSRSGDGFWAEAVETKRQPTRAWMDKEPTEAKLIRCITPGVYWILGVDKRFTVQQSIKRPCTLKLRGRMGRLFHCPSARQTFSQIDRGQFHRVIDPGADGNCQQQRGDKIKRHWPPAKGSVTFGSDPGRDRNHDRVMKQINRIADPPQPGQDRIARPQPDYPDTENDRSSDVG